MVIIITLFCFAVMQHSNWLLFLIPWSSEVTNHTALQTREYAMKMEKSVYTWNIGKKKYLIK